MADARHEALIRRFYDDMWNQFDTSVFAEILEPSIRFRGSLGTETVGFDEFAGYVASIEAFAPDFHNEIVSLISEGDRTFARLRYTGTHEGEVFGLPATGRRFAYAGAAVFTIPGDRIAAVWVLGDVYGLLQQLR